ncbi:MAG: biopolymer transporter ExbD [Pirellulaceae bacterium]|jgi:biopolymer transport protein ExbD|nr:biopolymer transporter ExbD [Pirellulaceae bacterium]
MPLKTHQDDMPAVNLTPMIDIVFQLIIFFMVGARFTELEKKVDLSVPEVGSTAQLPPAPEKRVINVYRDGRLELNKQPVTIEQLTTELADAQQNFAELGVVIRADADGPFQHVAAVLAACRQAGVTDTGISVRPGTKLR